MSAPVRSDVEEKAPTDSAAPATSCSVGCWSASDDDRRIHHIDGNSRKRSSCVRKGIWVVRAFERLLPDSCAGCRLCVRGCVCVCLFLCDWTELLQMETPQCNSSTAGLGSDKNAVLRKQVRVRRSALKVELDLP